jgi:hypothetical protein
MQHLNFLIRNKIHNFRLSSKLNFQSRELNWQYLQEMMQCMGFCDQWKRWIEECLISASVSVLVNGSPTKEFRVERGLRQGDPLSPFLFLIAAEGLGMLINKASEAGNFTGYAFGNHRERLSHLQFADDTLIIGPSTLENVAAIKAVLHLFELISGLKVNFHKSRLLGIKVSNSWVTEAAKFLNCKVGSLPFLYLGLPVGANPRRVSTWEPVIDKVKKRLSRWRSKNLSMGGRLVLLRSVLSAIPVSYLSFFKAPSGIVSKLESLFKQFLWGGSEDSKKVNWVKWDKVCLDKEHGGLGIKNVKTFNVALLGKWVWRMRVEKETLWYKTLKNKYGEEDGKIKIGRSASQWCKDIEKIELVGGGNNHNWFEEHVSRILGGGEETLFWSDCWVGGPLKRRFERLFSLSLNKEATVAEMRRGEDNREWHFSWRRDLFEWESEMLHYLIGEIATISFREGTCDNTVWLADSSKCYSAKSAYAVLSEK